MKDITNCPNCGAPLDELGYCKYCGTKVFRDNHGRLHYTVANCNVHPVAAEIVVSNEMLCHQINGDIEKMVYQTLAGMLAEELMKEAVIKQTDDYRHNARKYTARVLIADGKQYSRFLREDEE